MKKKITALLLVVSMLALSVVLYAKEDKGAELMILKKEGQEVGGELIAVKEQSFLLMDSRSGADVSVLFSDIHVLRIVKKSKALHYAGVGLLVGAMAGALFGAAVNDDNPGTFFNFSDTAAAGMGAGGFGLLGGLAGIGIGALVSMDDVFEFEELNKWELEELVDKLREIARVPDYN